MIDWNEIAARWVLEDVNGEEIVKLAIQALNEGQVSTNLAVLAGEDRPTIREVSETFEAALRDVGIELPDRTAASRLILSNRLEALSLQLSGPGVLDPWKAVERTAPIADSRVAQVHREVAPGHPLHGALLELIAIRPDVDDCLFEFMDGSRRVAEVHLTYSSRPVELPWPSTRVFDHLKTWRETFFPQAIELARDHHQRDFGHLA